MVKVNKSEHRIGRTSYIDIPLYNAIQVAAKVDTGADSSSIWATNIQERDGTLTFTLFGLGSAHYSGTLISTDSFEQVSVKNSFGSTEYRYKVKIPTVIEGRKIRVAFTLADRSATLYPVLIGRNTLKGKFYVDVSKKSSTAGSKRMLILSQKYSDNVTNMIRSIEDHAQGRLAIDYATYSDVIIRFESGNMRVFVKTYQRDVSEYTLIHFKTSVARDLTATIARYARSRGVKVIDLEAIRHFPDMSKLYQYAVLSTERLRVPDSIFMLPSQTPQSFVEYKDFLGLPFVLKGIHSSKGDVNNVVRSEEDFILIAQEALMNDVMLVGQKFVHNKGDYRILVFGKRITLVIHRVRKDDSTHLNNTSAGGTATIVPVNDLPPQVRLDSLRAAEVLGRTIAGVDAILDEEKQEWLFLEVNDGPQLATGSFLPEKHEQLAKYFLREVGK